MKKAYKYICLFSALVIALRLLLSLFNIIELSGSQSGGILLISASLALGLTIDHRLKSNIATYIQVYSALTIVTGTIVAFIPHVDIIDSAISILSIITAVAAVLVFVLPHKTSKPV